VKQLGIDEMCGVGLFWIKKFIFPAKTFVHVWLKEFGLRVWEHLKDGLTDFNG
jgi:hypothetical protein